MSNISASARANDLRFASKLDIRSIYDLLRGLTGNNYDQSNAIRHVLLLYEEPEFARVLQCQLLATGLKEGASCSCIAHDKSEVDIIEREMSDDGIDVNSYANSNRLKIKLLPNDGLFYSPPDGIAKDEIVSTLDLVSKISAYLYEGMEPPFVGYGIVMDSGTILYDNSDNDGHASKSKYFQLELEKAGQQRSANPSYPRLWVCPYFIKDISYSLDNDPLVQQLLLYHDAVIYATKDWNAIALDLRRE